MAFILVLAPVETFPLTEFCWAEPKVFRRYQSLRPENQTPAELHLSSSSRFRSSSDPEPGTNSGSNPGEPDRSGLALPVGRSPSRAKALWRLLVASSSWESWWGGSGGGRGGSRWGWGSGWIGGGASVARNGPQDLVRVTRRWSPWWLQ